jgi:hypothetical protein
MKIKLMMLFATSLYLASCAHTPSTGEQMLSHSEEAKKLGQQWGEGEKNLIDAKNLEKKGLKMIRQGNKQVSKGKSLISKGEKMIDQGNKMREQSKDKIKEGLRLKQESEAEFSEKYPGKLQPN